jgi:hypothetical protein
VPMAVTSLPKTFHLLNPKEDFLLKLRIASLTIILLALIAIPVMAQTDIYDNGPINGTVDAWTINSGFAVSDTFTIGSGGASVNGLRLWRLDSAWRRSPVD